MAWNNLTANWGINLHALARWFPYASKENLAVFKEEPIAMTRVIAKTHDLTEPEAREELENFLVLQNLAREAADFRSHDAR